MTDSRIFTLWDEGHAPTEIAGRLGLAVREVAAALARERPDDLGPPRSERDRRIIAMRRAGHTYLKIARAVGCSRAEVGWTLHTHAPELVSAELAAAVRARRDDRIVELRLEGWTLAAIGREVDLSPQGVSNVLAHRRGSGLTESR